MFPLHSSLTCAFPVLVVLTCFLAIALSVCLPVLTAFTMLTVSLFLHELRIVSITPVYWGYFLLPTLWLAVVTCHLLQYVPHLLNHYLKNQDFDCMPPTVILYLLWHCCTSSWYLVLFFDIWVFTIHFFLGHCQLKQEHLFWEFWQYDNIRPWWHGCDGVSQLELSLRSIHSCQLADDMWFPQAELSWRFLDWVREVLSTRYQTREASLPVHSPTYTPCCPKVSILVHVS